MCGCAVDGGVGVGQELRRQSVVVDANRSDTSAFGGQRAAGSMISGIFESDVASVEAGGHREDTRSCGNAGEYHEIIWSNRDSAGPAQVHGE